MNGKERKHTWNEILVVLLMGAVAVALGVTLLAMTWRDSAVRREVTVEAGEGTVSPALFLTDASKKAAFSDGRETISLKELGTHEVSIRVGNRTYKSRLIVSDTTPPKGTAGDREIGLSQRLTASDFVTDIVDATAVTVTFEETPAFGTEGIYEVPVRLTDAAGNTAVVRARLTVGLVRTTVPVDVSKKSVPVADFLLEPDTQARLLTETGPLLKKRFGDYPVKVQTGGRVYTSVLRVTDLTPPRAKPAEVTAWEDTKKLDPLAFVTAIQDTSAVTAAFVIAPTYGTLGDQTVTVRLTDAAGNSADFESVLHIVKDTVAPTFSGLETLTIARGEAISYKKGVTATDDKDGEVAFKVDSSRADPTKEGTYILTYIATDAAGNTATAKRTLVVRPEQAITRAAVDELAQKVLKGIVDEDDSPHEKLEAVYKWVSRHMYYVNSKEREFEKAAYVGFSKHRGDCYNFYAVTKVLLDACGIENQMIRRVGGKTNHYWLLVNIGTGWYHFDTTPHHARYPFKCFMKTDEEVWAYAKSRGDGRSDYYHFDTSLYPPRATEKYKEP